MRPTANAVVPLNRSSDALTNITKMTKAEKAIVEMPVRFWMNARDLAKNACLGVATMTKYLVQARKRGLAENKQVAFSSSRLHLWRRKTKDCFFLSRRKRACQLRRSANLSPPAIDEPSRA